MSLMQKYYDLKTIQKIGLLITFMSFFMIIIGVAGSLLLNEANNEAEMLYEQNLKSVDLYNELNTQTERNKVNLLLVVTANSTEDKNHHLKTLKALKISNDEIMGKLKIQKLDEYEKKRLDEYNKMTKKTRSIREEVLKAALNFQSDKANTIFEEKLETKLQERTAILDDLIHYNLEKAKVANETNEKKAFNAYIIMAFTIITAIILSVLFGCFIACRIQELLSKLVDKMNEMAKGNLNVEKFGSVSKSDVGQLCSSFDLLLDRLTNIIAKITGSVENISQSSNEMNNYANYTCESSKQTALSTTQLAQGAQEISRNVEDGAENINKMDKAIQAISEEAKVVAKLGNDTEINANTGAEHVKKAVEKIDSIKKVSQNISVNISELGTLSSEIEQIVDLIKNIAGQTNLLALNAAIEAARAGEHGKGFAVVADEVKKLAGQSAGATEKITSMIKEIQNKTNIAVSTMDKATHEVEEGVFVINDAGKALDNIITQVKTANLKIQGITKDIDSVAQTSEEMVSMIENISAITEETAASAEEISSITAEGNSNIDEITTHSNSLTKLAKDFEQLVSEFRIPSKYTGIGEKSYFLNLRLQDHHNWVKKLKNAIDTKNTKIQLQFDHTLCKFGKWYSSYKPTEQERYAFEKINKPHLQIHETGRRIFAELENGNQKAAETIFNNETLKLMKQIEELFEELKNSY